MILHFVIMNRTEHYRLVRYNWEGQLTEISLSKINDNDISQNEIRQKILLVKYLSTMHKISSKFSPSEIQGWKNSILKLEKSILQSKQHGETPFIVFRIEIWGSSLLLLRLVPKDENERIIRITIFFQSLERFEKKRCSIFYLRTFQNIHFSILPRLPIQFRISISKTSHRDRRRWLRIEDIQGGKGSSLLIWKKNDFEKEAEEEPWKKKRGASRNFSKQSWLINTTVAR